MPNYSPVANYAGIQFAPPAGWTPQSYDMGVDQAAADADRILKQLNYGGRLTPSQYAAQAAKFGWNTMTGKPMTSGPVGSTDNSMPTWTLPPGTPAGTTPTTGTATGVQVPYTNQAINPNDPNQRYKSVNITKSPDIAAGEQSLMETFKKGAEDSMKGFTDWLGEFKKSLGNAFTQSQTATNPAPTINTLQQGQDRYTAALDKNVADYAALNQNTAANEQAIVKQAQDLIPQYDQMTQDAINQQMGALQRGVSRYKLASGTPTSLGSNEEAMLTQGAANILVPMEQARMQRRYDVLGQYAMPAALDIANREQHRIGTFNPAIAQQEFQSGQVTAQTINQLQVIASQMARTDAVAFLQALGVPAQLQQQILSGQISQLGALGQVEGQANFQGLQDVLGALPSQPQYYNMGTGAYPNSGRYTPALGAQGGGGYATPMTAPNAPVTVGGTPGIQPQDLVWDATNQRWQNRNTGAIVPFSRYAAAAGDYSNYPGVEQAA